MRELHLLPLEEANAFSEQDVHSRKIEMEEEE